MFEKKELRIEVMTNIQQFIEESELLNHCLFNNNYYQKNNSLILSARYKGKIVESIEVNLERMEVAQARGYDNQPSIYNKKIVKLVQENLKAIKKFIIKTKQHNERNTFITIITLKAVCNAVVLSKKEKRRKESYRCND